MNKAQTITALAALALFLGLYWGFDTKPGINKSVERSRALQGESTSFESLLDVAKSQLSPLQTEQVAELEAKAEQAKDEDERISALKNLSGLWYGFGHLTVAGGFGEQVAELENADSSWSVAGAIFYSGLAASKDAIERQYCADHAVKAFESAASLAPNKPEHRVNLALVWAENPPPDNPMKAVMILRDLEKEYPENASVYNALGRLAIKTGQWDRAIERLEKAWSLDEKNPNTPCLLARAYEGKGNQAKATEFAALCKGG